MSNAEILSKTRGNRLIFSRKNGWGKTIEEIKPFIEWFTTDPEFWTNPDKKS